MANVLWQATDPNAQGSSAWPAWSHHIPRHFVDGNAQRTIIGRQLLVNWSYRSERAESRRSHEIAQRRGRSGRRFLSFPGAITGELCRRPRTASGDEQEKHPSQCGIGRASAGGPDPIFVASSTRGDPVVTGRLVSDHWRRSQALERDSAPHCEDRNNRIGRVGEP